MTQFDKEILLSLWKWKLLTMAAITELHFQNLTASYAHRRLLRLKESGLATWLHINGDKDGTSFAWTLTPKGFKSILESLPQLLEAGFKSETIEHDLLVTAFHLGEWISGIPKGCALFTEQELRRFHTDHYPEWIPQTKIHRPDGYWLVQYDNAPSVVALEVERSRKYMSDYHKTARFYATRYQELFRVVWLVESESTAKAILKATEDIDLKSTRMHSFMLEKEFRTTGWHAKFFLGRDAGKPLSRLLPSPEATLKRHVASMSLFNTSKSPHRSRNYEENRKIQICHRLVPSLISPPPSQQPSNKKTKGVPTNET